MSYTVNYLKNEIENVHRYCYTHTRTELNHMKYLMKANDSFNQQVLWHIAHGNTIILTYFHRFLYE